MDQAGNWSGGKPYIINFKVIRESSISNIYPYPNPFTTATKFVFTLTGDRVPDYMKIQIMTVAGKVVREVTQSELGPIRIGHNISEFTWDGTDEFGDPLGNGVYFYKVTAKLDGKEMDAFEGEDGRAFFKNGIGKMYLMR
jgi:flagellar hook assembly protein FlgD